MLYNNTASFPLHNAFSIKQITVFWPQESKFVYAYNYNKEYSHFWWSPPIGYVKVDIQKLKKIVKVSK